MLDQIKEIIATITILDVSEILPEEQLTEVVQGQVETQIPRIVAAINNQFEVDLSSSEVVELVKDEDHPMTVQELIILIEEELEL